MRQGSNGVEGWYLVLFLGEGVGEGVWVRGEGFGGRGVEGGGKLAHVYIWSISGVFCVHPRV